MRNPFTYFVLSLTLLVGFACKKELPKLPNSTEPIFFATGTIDGQQLSMRAGLENYSMQSTEWSWNGVPVYRGSITNGDSYFQMDLFTGNVWNLSSEIQDVLSQTELSCVTFPPLPLTFTAEMCAELSEFESIKFQINNDVPQAEVVLAEPGNWMLSCLAKQINGSEIQLSNRLIVGYDSRSLFRMSAHQSGNLISASISDFSQAVDSIKWSIGNFSVATTETVVQLPINTGDHILRASVYFKNGIVRERQISVGIGEWEPISDYVFPLESAWFQRFDRKAAMVIKLGTETYQSRQVTQDSPFQIQIISKSMYTDVITNQQYLKLKYELAAKFKKESDGTVTTGHFFVTIALPVP